MSPEVNAHSSAKKRYPWLKMTAVSVLVAVLALLGPSLSSRVEESSLPAQAQVINQRSFNVLNTTQPPAVFNAESVSNSSF
jgi:gluconolactonase